jgi:ABC-type multidrug transport system, ATPase component
MNDPSRSGVSLMIEPRGEVKTMLSIANLSKTYKGGKQAVKNLSLEVNDGDLYGFIGPNGAGKTTTLKCIAGILPFTEGEIRIDGHSVTRDPLVCKQVIAYIPDNPDLYESMTGIQFLNFIADVFKMSSGDRRAQITRYAEMFGMTENLNSPISSFSHGMKQKLAIISAVMHRPKLLILDEPFVGLDPNAAYQLKQTMRKLCSGGTAIFFSSHVLEVVEKLCNKLAIIKSGELVVSGETEQIKGNSTLENLFLELTVHE